MVAIPKIVLKSQTRMTLNERFTQYSEQQHARVQMLKNDLHTRITEDAIRRNGVTDTAELSRKLDNLQRVIESQIRRKSLSPQPSRRTSRHSPESHRPVNYGRYNEGYGESMIVPEYRALLYHGMSGCSGGPSSGGASGSSWHSYGTQGARKSRYDLTYGDVIQGGNRDYSTPSTSLYADALDHRAPISRRVDFRNNVKREYRDYWPNTRSRGNFRGSYGGARGGYGPKPRRPSSPRTYADEGGKGGTRNGAKRKYDNPLMRNSSDSEIENNEEDDWLDQDHFEKKRYGGIKSRLGIRSRLLFKGGGPGYGGPLGYGNGLPKRSRGGSRGRGFSRAGGVVRNGGGGKASRSKSQGRPVITKEDLDKELDDYHRKKGIIDDTTMQIDS
ncbi:hypothetical protein BIW11_10229 [Tropilaelaps mercedesae]|uniref:Chromatin target of PRMT1 protein C-terminal domain-containing protein n=1 Tax=Tropilaelaps mercedesae TaxID=418985 RepID=A0A1V9XGM1_9ACAR|nr:hypothetical protein BIW11_10229 [Tropilaelaps mercedesae]